MLSELIAEARVLVTPDTTTFRQLLVTQLATATKGVTVPIPVTAVAAGSSNAVAQQVAGANAAASAAARVTQSSAGATQAQIQMARAADLVALAERRAAAATTEVSRAQIVYRASISATAATFKAYQASLQTTDFLLIKQQRDAYATAKANEALALSNLQVARTESAKTSALAAGSSAQAASLAQTSRGAGAAALSLVGLRGATLAATGPFLAGAAAATALAKSIQLATSFNSQIAVLGATTGATGEQLSTAAEAAREFGRDITLPGVTAGDAAQTITEFAKAGLTLNDSIAATRGGLQLAQAAQLSYADSVTLTANALNAFGLSGNQAVRVADTLANAANLAQGGIEDTALALRQAAGAAAVVGVSFEDTTALLTLLARNGLTGSDAGTALRTAFLRLVNPSDEAKEVLADLNVQLRDLNGNVRPEVFAEFAAAQRNLSAAQQQANAAIVFGQDAFRAFGFLGREGTRGLEQVRAGLDQTGTAARIAQARMTGLAGAQENLSNQLSSLGETIGQLATPPLIALVNELAEFVAIGNEAVGTAKDLGGAIGDILPDTPSVGGFSFTDLISTSFKVGNPIGQARTIIGLFNRGKDDIEDAVKNGGVELRSAVEEAGREAARGAVSFGEQFTNAIRDAFNLINEVVAQQTSAFRAGQFADIGRATGQAAGLDEQFDAILAGGGSVQQQLANLRKQAAIQAKIIAEAGPNAQGDLLKARREAQARLAAINQQIAALEAQIVAEQKAANQEAQRLRDEAKRDRDQAFLQAQEDARTAQERRVTLAGDTPQLADDIRRQIELRALIQRQIAAIKASALDEKQKQAALRELRAERDRTTDAINDLRQADREARDAAREERLDAQEALAQSIFDLTGNRNPLLRAINAQIKEAQADARAAKKGSTEWLRAKTEINNLIKQRRELFEEAKEADDSDGLTVAEILRENAETFNRTGGNLISGSQPFAGPTGFTADVAQFLTRGQGARVEVVTKTATTQENLQRQLIEQLRRLTDALEQSNAVGGDPTMRDYADITSARAVAMARFYTSRQARQLTEAENA